ncbi:MAG: maleylpyruvate isomerase family mycothiol-dependent enzyme [Acidimicrobiia bacterium]
MDAIVGALSEQHAELAGLLAALDEEDWQRPAPSCEGWAITDVVLHLAQTDELAIGSARGSFESGLSQLFTGGGAAGNVDEAAEMMVTAERGEPGAVIFERWRTSADELRGLLATCDPHARVQWVSGELSARTLATTRLAESWIHTGDVAEALGIELPASDRLWHVARLAWRTVPYAFARSSRETPGPVAFELLAPDGGTWEFVPEAAADTVIRGDAIDLCLVAARRVDPADTSLRGEGPDAEAVLELVRTYA